MERGRRSGRSGIAALALVVGLVVIIILVLIDDVAAGEGEEDREAEVEGFADLRDCVHRAALLSNLVYKASASEVRDVVHHYNSRMPFQFVYTSLPDESRAHKLIIARDKESNTLYICFRGSETVKDFFINLRVGQRELNEDEDLGAFDGGVGGLYHGGFAHTVKQNMPRMRHLRRVIARHRIYGSGRVVFCGHSLGGAVAHLALVKYMISIWGSESYTKNAIAIAFGAPHFGNDVAREFLKANRWQHRLFNFVADNDPVPLLLNDIPQSVQAITGLSTKEAYQRMQEWANLVGRGARGVPALVQAALNNIEALVSLGFDFGRSELPSSVTSLLSIVVNFRTIVSSTNDQLSYVPIGVYRSLSHELLGRDVVATRTLKMMTWADLVSHRMGTYFHHILGPYLAVPFQRPAGDPHWPAEVKPGPAPSLSRALLVLSATKFEVQVEGLDLELLVSVEMVPNLRGPWRVSSVSDREMYLEGSVSQEMRDFLSKPHADLQLKLFTCFGQTQRAVSTWPRATLPRATLPMASEPQPSAGRHATSFGWYAWLACQGLLKLLVTVLVLFVVGLLGMRNPNNSTRPLDFRSPDTIAQICGAGVLVSVSLFVLSFLWKFSGSFLLSCFVSAGLLGIGIFGLGHEIPFGISRGEIVDNFLPWYLLLVSGWLIWLLVGYLFI